MTALRGVSLLPFVPSGSDYDGSRKLFQELGFVEEFENNGYAGFRSGEAQFILQRFADRAFAENFMVQLNVADVDAWWREVAARQLEQKFPGFRIAAPQDHPWGRQVDFIDMAGVCWHVGSA